VPQAKNIRRGSVGTLLVFVFTVVMILLPLGLKGLTQLCDVVLLQQSQNFLEQLLPSVFLSLDQDKLAEGYPVLQDNQAELQLRHSFAITLPDLLKERLRLDSIEFIERRILPDPDHWMGGNQPTALPVVILHAVFLDHQGQEIHLRQAIEILLD
jgi:hypothetical protein